MEAKKDHYLLPADDGPEADGKDGYGVAVAESSDSEESSPDGGLPHPAGDPAWDERFQEILDLIHQDRAGEAFPKLAILGEDFSNTALTYGRMIISEFSRPADQKTIRPVRLGGVAGGEKYIVCGLHCS